MNWISVKDALPELIEIKQNVSYSMPVLVSDGKNYAIGFRWSLGTKEYFTTYFQEYIDIITHWMPLPETPEVSK
jgi:Protein of unknown function (DUF551)